VAVERDSHDSATLREQESSRKLKKSLSLTPVELASLTGFVAGLQRGKC
jgi:hypothetical protein